MVRAAATAEPFLRMAAGRRVPARGVVAGIAKLCRRLDGGT
jgi:adenosylmethionine-8-amino-7-oxononanoate aminotransferase